MNTFIAYITKNVKKYRIKGFFHLLSANALIQLVAFASQLFVAGILAPDDIGRIKIIQTYLSVISIAAGMGFNVSTLKLCSENRPNLEQITLFKAALIFTLISTITIYSIVLGINYFGFFTSDNIIQLLVPLGLFPVISNSLFMVFVSYLHAKKEFKLMSSLVSSNKLIAIILIILFVYFWGIKGYYWAYNLSLIIVLIVCYKIYNGYPKIKSGSINRSHLSTHWRYAKLATISNILSEISNYADILLIGFFIKNMHQIGYYGFALTIIIVIRLIPGTVQQISIPFFSSLSINKSDLLAKFKYYNKILYLVVGATLIVFILFVPTLIHWVFRAKYDDSIQYLVPLAVGWSIRQLLHLQVGIIFGLGKIEYNLYTSLLSLLFNIVALSIALYFYGLTGAAFASIPSGIFIVLCSNYYFKKTIQEL